MPLKEFFSNDKSGSKKRMSYLRKFPEVLSVISDWTNRYGLQVLTLEEQIYHCVNELKTLPIDLSNGLLREYRGPSKGYSVHGKPRKDKLHILKDLDLNQTGGSLSQKISNDLLLLNQLLEIYPQEDVPIRVKVKLYSLGLKDVPLCEKCKINRVKFQPSGVINKTCSEKCRRALEQKTRSSKYILGDRVVRVQGYEMFVIEELLHKYRAEEILVSDEIKPIPYGNGKMYHPDILIKSENKIIEVKSSYTFRKDYLKNMEKKKGALKAGFLFEFHIWDLKQIIKYEN